MRSKVRSVGVKGFFGTSVAMGALLTAHIAFASAPTVPVSSQNVFVPRGFDDNDQVMVVLDGYLPSSCYRIDRVEKTINEAEKTINIQQFARVYPGPCLMMLVPFSTEVDLGIMAKGDYKVITNKGGLENSLNVARANNAGPDDYLYAPVDSARVERGSDGVLSAVLEGRFTNTCMEFSEVNVIYSGATLEVLPKMTVADRTDCADKEIPFRRVEPLSKLEAGRYLLHVRSLNGKAVNAVFPVFEYGDPIF